MCLWSGLGLGLRNLGGYLTSGGHIQGDYLGNLTSGTVNHGEKNLRVDRDRPCQTPSGNTFEGAVVKTPLRSTPKSVILIVIS